MKKAIIKSALFTIVLIGISSCQKFHSEPTKHIVGNYIGSGTDGDGNSFSGMKVQINRISQKRVKVEPIGHSYISPFEIDVEEVLDKVIGITDTSYTFAAQFEGDKVTVVFAAEDNMESFSGERQ